tara:strand:+ start:608 stop:1579 length:972 start_codon:yes stop_codon:yes gene_type:complete
MAYEYEKYITDIDSLKNTIERYGVGIIPNVLNDDEIKQMNDGMWDYLEYVSQKFDKPIQRNDRKSWVHYLKMFPKHSMLLQQFGVGHAQYIWDLRQNENIADIFSRFWDVPKEDLLVSFDGASFHFPPEDTNRGWYRQTWYHTDQSYLRPEFECLQSWITGLDVEEGDATLAFMEGSNKYHDEFRQKFGITDRSDWFRLEESEQKEFYDEKGCIDKKIHCPAGSMVFWDSRTIHCGTEPMKRRKNKNLRNVAYICMTPRDRASDAMLNKKRKAFKDLRMTSHWPHKPKLFPKNPRTYGNPLPNITEVKEPKLTNLGYRLAGFD